MATGLLVKNVCYDTVNGSTSAAHDAYFSSIAPVVFQDGFNPSLQYTVVYEQLNGVWMRNMYAQTPSIPSQLWTSIIAPAPSLPPCYSPSESFADGVNIGWAFSAVLAGVLFVLMVKKNG